MAGFDYDRIDEDIVIKTELEPSSLPRNLVQGKVLNPFSPLAVRVSERQRLRRSRNQSDNISLAASRRQIKTSSSYSEPGCSDSAKKRSSPVKAHDQAIYGLLIPKILVQKIRVQKSDIENCIKLRSQIETEEGFKGFETIDAKPTPTLKKFGHLINYKLNTTSNQLSPFIVFKSKSLKLDPETVELLRGKEKPIIVLKKFTGKALKEMYQKELEAKAKG